ncbi:MAG: aminoacyl-tRNA hydrolase [Geminocystis sp.]|nr:aminoacyl-tRNA hydrolase [Geminocystis sp.]MCS7148497.1 aminoacyl-tRNA hydrolase [Geminocystis sp.]MDW8114929.1 aminoacyl-tRNA hydrolase [Geminocystis sp.]MDW8464196.1 aminoacyl-tRNA hydrolase [Geminocystis sp.]
MKEKKLIIPEVIVGLGNPGAQYEHTRHNIGFEIVDFLADKWGLVWQKSTKFQGLFTEGFVHSQKRIFLLKPLTYMNNSGISVRAILDWYKLSTNSILVVYDDMDLPFGKIRLRLSGSSGGHNGIKSIISHLGTQDFPRFRVGIGKSVHKDATVSHVLGKFSPQEREAIPSLLDLCYQAIDCCIREGVEKGMSIYNQKSMSLIPNTAA